MEDIKRHSWNLGIMLAWIVLLVACCANHLFGDEPVRLDRATVTDVVDGDTIHAEIHLGAGVSLESQPIRVSNYDAWERSRFRRSLPFRNFTEDQWQAEIIRGDAAQSYLGQLLLQGDLYVALEDKRDTYGRLLGKLYVYRKETEELVDVGKVMREQGHVRN